MKRALPLLLLMLAVAGACGKKGPPRPPLPPFPLPPAAPSVRQAGAQVELLVNLPAMRLDGQPITAFAGMEVLRDEQPLPRDGERPAPWPPGMGTSHVHTLDAEERATLVPGGTWLYRDVLLMPDESGGERLVRYRVRYLLQGRRWSGAGEGVTLSTGPPVPAPADLRAASTNEGVRLTWTRAGDGLATAIYRSPADADMSFTPVTQVEAGTTVFTDPTAVVGRTYRYEVRARWSQEDGDRYSEAAGPVTVTLEDHFPPHVPQGVQALERPGGVDLFWLPGEAFDLAGYRVWRRPADGGEEAWTLLTPDPVTGSSFTDERGTPGQATDYAVSAVDSQQPANESARSAAVRVVIPAPPSGSEGQP